MPWFKPNWTPRPRVRWTPPASYLEARDQLRGVGLTLWIFGDRFEICSGDLTLHECHSVEDAIAWALPSSDQAMARHALISGVRHDVRVF